MASLTELTDRYADPEQTINGLPVEPLYLPNVNTNDVILGGNGEPTRITVRPEPMPDQVNGVGSKVDKILNNLFRDDEKRYQLWPEKVIRGGLTAAGDVLAGNVPQWAVDNDTGDVHTSPQMIEKAQEVSALAGTGGLVGGAEGTALNATPSLRPALKYKDKIYKGKEGQQHQDVIPKELYPEFEQMAMNGEDISHYNFGFMNHKGQFLDREKALEYAINEGLLDAHAGQYGALTSTLMADSSKPGTAIEAMAKADPFFSALEHNVKNISQSKMTGDQWLGTLSNKPGVKPEELQWTGLGEFLKENAGKPVTKEQIEQHLASNKVELKEVNKGGLKNQNDELAKAEYGKAYDELGPFQQRSVLRKLEETGVSGETKYHSYQLPGGENYREMLMTLPESKANYYNIKDLREAPKHSQPDANIWYIDAPDNTFIIPKSKAKTLEDAKQYIVNNKRVNQEQNYKSSHWDEPNILAHVRMNDRTIEGKKSLHMEEIQSDWHQQGRDKGYQGQGIEPKGEVIHDPSGDAKYPWRIMVDGKEWNRTSGTRERALAELEDGIAQAKKKQNLVPDAPFKKNMA